MAEPVEWRADGSPFSPRFQRRHRSGMKGIAQSRQVFLAGCGLPESWCGANRWCVLQTGFGLGTDFLCTWQAWRDDPQRPHQLHYLATEPWPVDAQDIRRGALADAGLAPLGEALAERWWGLDPGTHRIELDGGRVLLTLLIGDGTAALRGLGRLVDSVFLDGFTPELWPDPQREDALRAVARCCRRDARLATWTQAAPVRTGLASAGFAVDDPHEGLPALPVLLARLAHLPARHVDPPPLRPTRCVVIGAGLAGAAVARALALRGWRVTVLDAGPKPASGASGVPAGLFAPHVSADDAVLSRLTRAGVRALLNVLPDCLHRGLDWDLSGVVQRHDDGGATHHTMAGWLRPARLVAALLATPGISVEYGRRLTSLADLDGALMVVAAGFETLRLLTPGFPLQPVAGQVAFGRLDGAPALRTSETPSPFNGHGHFLPSVPSDDGDIWLAGASFERDVSAVEVPAEVRAAHHAANLRRLGELRPALARGLPALFASARTWRGVRATSPDRLPIVGPWPPSDGQPVWLCTALGARGMTLALLCADLLVARLLGEPLPVTTRLAQAVSTERIARRMNASGSDGR
ncbi:FAD-dependent oxidoreductase [Xylophilus sp. Kf1]|nr:FAD-dependent oxidoreductase [Xylophilus sp. Kf1]